MRGRFHPDPCLAHVAAWIGATGTALAPDRSMAQRFLHWLDAEADRFSFRTFSDTPYTRLLGTDPLEHALHGSLASCWERLVDLNRRGAAIAVTINQTDGRSRSAEAIQRVRALFLDDDLGLETEPFPLTPHCRVASSNGHNHYYWRVSGLNLDEFVACQRRLAANYGGDSRVAALNQAMQLPGFWRRKRITQPLRPSIVYCDSAAPYPPGRLSALLGDDWPG